MQHVLYYLSYLKIPFSAEVFVHYRLTLLLFLAVVFLSYIIDFYLSQSFLGEKYRYFLAPGVIVHELSHGFACFFTGAKVTQMSMFEKSGGHVKHTKSKLPIIGSVLISLAPLIVGIVMIYFISRYLSTADLNLFKYGYSAKAIVAANISLIKSLSGFSIKNWILLYLTISVAVTMLPSGQDILNAFIPLLIIIFAFLVLSKYSHIFLPMGSLNMLLFTVINLLILAAVLSIIVFALTNIFSPSRRSG